MAAVVGKSYKDLRSSGMFDEINICAKDVEKKVPEGHLPYSRRTLTKELIEHAAKYINENEELKRKTVKEIIEYARTVLKVPFHIEEEQALIFLRTKKYDIKKACQLLQTGADFIESHQYIFCKDRVVSKDVVRRVVESGCIGFLPYRDAKGRAIVLIRAACWNPQEISAEDAIYGAIVALHIAGENEINQVAGYVTIADFQNLAVQQVIAMSRWIIFGIQAMQKCCPCLVKEFHVLHVPPVYRATWKLVKNFITEKIRKRVIFHKTSNWDSLHSRIPPEILTEELGGHLGPYSHEHWAGDINGIENTYQEKLQAFLCRKKTD